MPRRRQPLVCQHIENLSSAALERHAAIIREIVGRRHGVYALYRRDKLYYVGLAGNLRNRLKAHLRDRHKGLWDRFSVYLTIDDGHMRELESLVLRIAQPKANRQKGKFFRSENLTPTLRQRLLEQQRAEWFELIGRAEKLEERAAPRRRGSRRAKGDAVLKGFFKRGVTLRGTFKGRTYKARVRQNGTIRYKKRVFDSPSLAAAAVVKRPINGWWFWRFERAPGLWVRLRELRN